MHILILALCYAPEEVSAAVLVTELATDLVKKGHCVTIITGAPSYPYGKVFPGYKNKLYQTEFIDGVKVIRVWSWISFKRTYWRRIIYYATFTFFSFLGGLSEKNVDIIDCFSPPLPLGFIAWMLSLLYQKPWILQLEDIFPDAAISLGVIKNKWAIKILYTLERFIYQRANHISIIAESFRKNLLRKNVPPEKMTLIPVWADANIVQPQTKENLFRKEFGLAGKFVILYAGNMGMTSCLEDIIDAADLLRANQDIVFLLVGEGVKKEFLQAQAQEKGEENVIFLPYQPREKYPEMMATADISLVTLNSQACETSLPSKVFNIMASGRAIMAVTTPTSDLAKLVEDGHCGFVISPGKPEKMAEVILDMVKRPEDLEEMGKNGRLLLEKQYARVHCVDLYEKMLLKIGEKKGLTA
jgi:colanic acid biosynthesis glycosyl transferase WcaI